MEKNKTKALSGFEQASKELRLRTQNCLHVISGHLIKEELEEAQKALISLAKANQLALTLQQEELYYTPINSAWAARKKLQVHISRLYGFLIADHQVKTLTIAGQLYGINQTLEYILKTK